MTTFQWVVLAWLGLLTIGFVILRMSVVGTLLDLMTLSTSIRRENARMITQAITAHAEAPLDQAHPDQP